MSLITQLKQEAMRRGLAAPEAALDAAAVFALVRDMPYRRAADRQPETIIEEWQGTCSGKHYLLQALFAELGLRSQVMASTTAVPVASEKIPESLQPLYQAANRHYVDVHNYLLVDLPGGGQMVVDATWPMSGRQAGLRANEEFFLGQDQQILADPIETWPIPPDRDPQEFKEELLQAHFSSAELAFREIIIQTLGELT